MSDFLDILMNAGFWAATIRIMSPLIFGTLGELICERAGVLNLGIEGIMTVGAMAGWMWVYQGGGLWDGVLFAAAMGALFGLLHAAFTVHLGLSQHVTGIGITAGYHRLFSHRAYDAAAPVRFVFALIGGAAWQSSIITWAASTAS